MRCGRSRDGRAISLGPPHADCTIPSDEDAARAVSQLAGSVRKTRTAGVPPRMGRDVAVNRSWPGVVMSHRYACRVLGIRRGRMLADVAAAGSPAIPGEHIPGGTQGLQVITHSGGHLTIGPLTDVEAAEWETNLAASAGYLIGVSVRRIQAAAYDVDPAQVPATAAFVHAGSFGAAYLRPGLEPIERLRIVLCGRHGPERARQLMASLPHTYEAWHAGTSTPATPDNAPHNASRPDEAEGDTR